MERSSRMLRVSIATTVIFFSLSLVGCPSDNGGGSSGGGTSTTPAPALPAGLVDCFGADTAITITGTYTIVGISKSVNRSGKIGDLGLKFEVARESQDELPENVPVDKWNGPLVTTTQDPDDEDCWELEYKSAAFTVAGDSGCRFIAKGTVCPGSPCTVTNSSWSVTCDGPVNLGSGSWDFS